MKIKCPFCLKLYEIENSLRNKTFNCDCGHSHNCKSIEDENTEYVIDSTKNIIMAVKVFGWILGIISILSAIALSNHTDTNFLFVPLLISGVVLILSGIYLGGIIYLMQEQIKRQNEILHEIKAMKK